MKFTVNTEEKAMDNPITQKDLERYTLAMVKAWDKLRIPPGELEVGTFQLVTSVIEASKLANLYQTEFPGTPFADGYYIRDFLQDMSWLTSPSAGENHRYSVPGTLASFKNALALRMAARDELGTQKGEEACYAFLRVFVEFYIHNKFRDKVLGDELLESMLTRMIDTLSQACKVIVKDFLDITNNAKGLGELN